MLFNWSRNFCFIFMKVQNPFGLISKIKMVCREHRFNEQETLLMAFQGIIIRMKFLKFGFYRFIESKLFNSC